LDKEMSGAYSRSADLNMWEIELRFIGRPSHSLATVRLTYSESSL
jgi:hypothetical protein